MIKPLLPIEWDTSAEPVPYPYAMERMERRVDGIIAGETGDRVWFLEHPPLYTQGTSAKGPDLLDGARFPVFASGRGGQFTYHGPGQRVAYLMLDLKTRGQDIRRYVQQLEQCVIATLAAFGVTGHVREGRIGVWVEDGRGLENKIAAIGIRVRKWVAYHGISINVHPDLSHYAGIVPCGISGFGVTSLKALGVDVSLAEVDVVLRREIERCFGVIA
jgi:lipoyl(octanoyl) transferase